jgi:O-antigen/teichoic acid export membrane protein
MMVGFGVSFMVLGVLLGLRIFGFFASRGSERLGSLKRRERVTSGQKIVSLYLLSLGLIFFALSTLIYPWSGDSSSGGWYFTLIIGALFVVVAVLVVLDAYYRALHQKEPLR